MREFAFGLCLCFGLVSTVNAQVVDETINLNIKERRIRETDYQASTSVELQLARIRSTVLQMRIGASVNAKEIDLLLRNVNSNGRFYSELDFGDNVNLERSINVDSR